jgi:hypothetical protein
MIRPQSHAHNPSTRSSPTLPRLFQIKALLLARETRPANVARRIVRCDKLDEMRRLLIASLTTIKLLFFRHYFLLDLKDVSASSLSQLHQPLE